MRAFDDARDDSSIGVIILTGKVCCLYFSFLFLFHHHRFCLSKASSFFPKLAFAIFFLMGVIDNITFVHTSSELVSSSLVG